MKHFKVLRAWAIIAMALLMTVLLMKMSVMADESIQTNDSENETTIAPAS